MARKAPKIKELTVPEKKELVYSTFEECEEAYVARIRKIVDDTDFLCLRCNISTWIENKVITPVQYFVERKHTRGNYSAEELEKALNLVNNVTQILSEKTRFTPTIFTFCKMLGISTYTLDNWSYERNDRGDVVLKIQDYFKSLLSQGMLTGEFNPVAGQFIGKTTLGMRERDNSGVNINILGNDLSVDDIMQEYYKKHKLPIDN